MTSKFNIDNRELLQRISCGRAVAGIDFGNLIVRELAAFRLAAMDSEPVGEFYEDGPLNWYQISDGDRVPAHRRIPLYRHAKPAPELKPVGYLFVSDQGAVAYSPTNWGMPGFRLIGQIYGDMSVELPAAPQEVNHG